MLTMFPIKINIHKTSNHEECFTYYKKNTYKNIFIDCDDEYGKLLVEKITQDNPNQKLLLLNNDLKCQNIHKCESCEKQFNKISLIKPLSQEQISKVISNKLLCESKDKNEFTFTMEKINKKIYKKFPYFKYKFNKEYTILSSEMMDARILVFVTDLLNKYQIEYEVEDYDKIIIHEK